MAKASTKEKIIKAAQFEENMRSIEGGFATGIVTGAAAFGLWFGIIIGADALIPYAATWLKDPGAFLNNLLVGEELGCLLGASCVAPWITKRRLNKMTVRIGKKSQVASIFLALVAAPIGFSAASCIKPLCQAVIHPAPAVHIVLHLPKKTQG